MARVNNGNARRQTALLLVTPMLAGRQPGPAPSLFESTSAAKLASNIG